MNRISCPYCHSFMVTFIGMPQGFTQRGYSCRSCHRYFSIPIPEKTIWRCDACKEPLKVEQNTFLFDKEDNSYHPASCSKCNIQYKVLVNKVTPSPIEKDKLFTKTINLSTCSYEQAQSV